MQVDTYTEIDGFDEVMVVRLGDKNPLLRYIISKDSEGLSSATGIVDEGLSNEDFIKAYQTGESKPSCLISKEFAFSLEVFMGRTPTKAAHRKDSEVDDLRIDIDNLFSNFASKHLPPVMIKACQIMGKLEDRINVEGALDFFAAGDGIARAQAISKYPILYKMSETDSGILGLIDQRKPIIDPIFRKKHGMDGVSIASLKSLNKVMADALDDLKLPFEIKTLCNSPNACIHISNTLDKNQMPKNPEDLREMASIYLQLNALNSNNADKNHPTLIIGRTLKSASQNDWKETRARCSSLIGRYSQHSNGSAGDYIKSVSGILSGAIINNQLSERGMDFDHLSKITSDLLSDRPVDENGRTLIKTFSNRYRDLVTVNNLYTDHVIPEIETGLRRAILNNVSLKDLEELTERWHHNTEQLQSDAMSSGGEVEWSPLSAAAIVLPNGFTARELSSSTALTEQGRKENHCVGSYASVVLKDHHNSFSLIFSIEKNDEIASTCEVKLSQSGWGKTATWTAINAQHRAHSNGDPSDAAEAAAGALVDYINEMPDDLKSAYVKNIQLNPGELKQEVARTIQSLGHGNIFSKELGTTALDAHRKVLPKPLRDLSASELYDIAVTEFFECYCPEKKHLGDGLSEKMDSFIMKIQTISNQPLDNNNSTSVEQKDTNIVDDEPLAHEYF